MTKFTREQSRQIDQAVKETIIKRFTYLEAINYIQKILGYSISPKTYFTKKAKLRKDAASWFDRLQKKEYEYHSLYGDRYDELNQPKREAWATYNLAKEEGDTAGRVKALSVINDTVAHLTNLIQLFPYIGGAS